MTQNFQFHAGLNDNVFEGLKFKVDSLKDIDKNCCLCLDEMSIKSHLFYIIGNDEVIGFEDLGKGKTFKPALNSLVLMIKGIYSNWKLPLAYYFTHNSCKGRELQNIIEECIQKLKTINLSVKVVVNDMGSSNICVSNILNVTPERPFFTVDGEDVVYMFDVPHLLKATRNMLMKHIFYFDGKSTSWSHVVNFYNKDKSALNRLAPKLTDAHVHPSKPEKMKVFLAAHVLSARVAAAMTTYVALGELPPEATATIECIERFDKLFDILNSIRTKDAKEFNRAFKGLDYQINFLNDMSLFLNNVKVFSKKNIDVTNRIKCIRGWKISIKAVIHLWYQCLKPCGFEFLLTRRLCQDALENFFGSVRQQAGNSINPTPIQFQRAFRKLFNLKLFCSTGSENCAQDLEKILNVEINKVNRYNDATAGDTSSNIVEIKDCDYQLHAVEQNSIRYTCGYLIRKCLTVHKCDICEKYANEHQDLDETTLYSHFRAYQNKNMDTFGNLYMPNNNFFFYICHLEDIFKNNFEEIVLKKNCLDYFISHYSKILLKHPCEHFPHTYLLKLYSRMRLFYCLKFVNRNFKVTNEKGEKICRKMIIWSHS
jgi:hypothetical protein